MTKIINVHTYTIYELYKTQGEIEDEFDGYDIDCVSETNEENLPRIRYHFKALAGVSGALVQSSKPSFPAKFLKKIAQIIYSIHPFRVFSVV